jgi:hypothetical protein
MLVAIERRRSELGGPAVGAASGVWSCSATAASYMRSEPAAYLWDVREAALRTREFVVGHDFVRYARGELVQSAVDAGPPSPAKSP